jgi:hypothetical protein
MSLMRRELPQHILNPARPEGAFPQSNVMMRAQTRVFRAKPGDGVRRDCGAVQRPRTVSVLTRTGGVALPAAVNTCMQVLRQASRALASSAGPRTCFRSARSRTSRSTKVCSSSGIAIECRDVNEDAIALIGRHRFLRHRCGNELGINPIEPQQVDQCDCGHAAVVALRIAAGHPSALPPQPGKGGDQRVRIGRARDAERLGLLPACIGEEGGANELSIDDRRGLSRDCRGKAKGENSKDPEP